MTLTEVTRGGSTWRLGTAADVAWIDAGTSVGKEISSAVPDVFDAYATIVLPEDLALQPPHDAALLSVLSAHATDRRWWLGYLDTGADDVVFPDAPRVTLYEGWSYVPALAEAEQASTWRRPELGSFWSGRLPNLMFPLSRSWLVSTYGMTTGRAWAAPSRLSMTCCATPSSALALGASSPARTPPRRVTRRGEV